MESREWRREREREGCCTISAADKMSLASHRPLSCPPPPPLLRPPPPLFPPWQPCTALLTQAATADAAAGKAARKRFAPPFSFSFLLLSFSLSPSPLRVCTEGGTFPTSCFQLVPRLFRPFSSLCPPPIRNTFYSCTRIRSRFSQAAARIYIYIYVYICSSVDIFLFFYPVSFFFLEWFLWYLGGLIPSGCTTFDRVTPFVAHLFHGSVCRSVHDWISRFGSKFFLSFLPFFL